MNSTPLVARNETPKIEHASVAQPLHVVGAPRPKVVVLQASRPMGAGAPGQAWGASHGDLRLPTTLTSWRGSWILSSAQIADETGQGERTVRRHINEDLRQYFSVQDRPGCMWKFTIPAPLMAVVEPRPNRPDTPAKLADVPCKVPGKYVPPQETPELPEHLESVGAGHGLKCRRCQHSWPAAAGRAHLCATGRRAERPNRARTSDSRRSEAINAARLARIRRECADHAPASAKPRTCQVLFLQR